MTYDGRGPTAHLHLRLPQTLKKAVEREASERRIPMRSLFEAALRDRYDPDRNARDGHLVVRELKALRREVTHVSAGNRVLFEALGLLVKNLFSSLTPPTAEGRLAGDLFYARFIDAVTHAIETNEALMDRVLSLAIVTQGTEQPQTSKENPDA